MKAEGIITLVKETPWKEKIMYAFAIDSQDGLFGTGDVRPPTEGTRVSFEYTMKGKWNNITPDTIEVLGTASAADIETATDHSVVAQYESGPSRQDSIIMQSSRKDALVFLGLVLSEGGLNVGKTMSKKLGILKAALNELTTEFFWDIKKLNVGEAPEEEPNMSEIFSE